MLDLTDEEAASCVLALFMTMEGQQRVLKKIPEAKRPAILEAMELPIDYLKWRITDVVKEVPIQEIEREVLLLMRTDPDICAGVIAAYS